MRAGQQFPALVMALWVTSFLPASAFELILPANASLTAQNIRNPDTYLLPVGPYTDGAPLTTRTEGRVLQQAWSIQTQGMTTLQIMRPLQDQLLKAGYDILYDCVAQVCGGFDFRFNIRVMAAPDMFVDLFDYRYLAAIKGDPDNPSGANYVSLLVSRSGVAGYVQIIHVTPGGSAPEAVETSEPVPGVVVPSPDDSLVRQLIGQGHIILGDLDFEVGSSKLEAGRYASLGVLAAFLKSDPTRRVALVGHTDTVGTLENNIALSRRRAASVLARLVQDYDVPRSQLDAEGMGYLSPIGPNLTAEGRERNRRVEAVLLNDR